ncbi:NADPH-dependent diflavin oxidoreductase 1 [Podila minutissima]|uniref:NADPH-dependent diflavin oxidoreductase 1 n=1 Tax=Podila minutissima TaxID=64525 RepID=A0A9P5SC57_9FUNG|nr:NADPH-dependent diflavin oxidoreductase 1 [Podila minutissima]
MSTINNSTAAHSGQNTAADPAQLQFNSSSPHVDPHQLDHISIHSPRRILFLYGSQTGCAQDVAENAAREARRMHFSASVSAMDDYDRSLLIREHFVVFVASTTGQGEEPDNMKKFWRFLLRKSHPSDALDHMEYTVLGLGDSSYIKFNWPAKKLYKRLLQLGAIPFYEPAYADDQHYLGIIPENVIFQNSFSLSFDQKDTTTSISKPEPTPLSADIPEPGTFLATMIENRRITNPKHSQDVRHIELLINDPLFPGYHPGDVLSMRPRNLAKDVNEFLEYSGWTSIADDPLTVVENLADHQLPKHISHRQTLRSLFTNYLNVFTTPRTSFFQLLIHFTPNEDEKDKLREFVSPAGQDDLYSYSHRMRRTIFEVMQDFKDVRIPLNYILDVFPVIMPRSFSIASAPLVSVQEQHQSGRLNGCVSPAVATSNGQLDAGNIEGELQWKVDLCVAIVHYKTKLWKWRVGICTKWLKSLHAANDPGLPIEGGENTASETETPSGGPSQFMVRVQRGTLKLPKDPSTPLICIGPGANKNVLFFGCRKRAMDYHYQGEWEQLEREGSLRVFAACSRDQDDKVYVQHLIEAHGALVWKYLHEEKGIILLSGSSNRMPADVTRALQRVISTYGNMSIEQAHDYLTKVEKEGRFQQECWA